MTKVKQQIEQFKKDNGNVSYTVKELIGALHIKVDNINEKLELKVDRSLFWKITGALFTLLLLLLGYQRVIGQW